MDRIRAIVLGASGFGGAELLRLIAAHPQMTVVSAGAGAMAGQRVTEIYPSLTAYEGWRFVSTEEALGQEADVVFSSLPTGESSKLLAEERRRVIDLSSDFRSASDWVYGLPEKERDRIRDAQKVANPGCYPTASLVSLLPLAEEGLLEGVVNISATSGVSGAGRAAGQTFSFNELHENVRPYRITGHDHISEMEHHLSAAAGLQVTVTFVPMLVPAMRGILSVSVVKLSSLSRDDFLDLYRKRYDGHPFVRVVESPALPEPGSVRMTNVVEVSIRTDERSRSAICVAALDNLVKGAAGQAVQNANLMFGLDETLGLDNQAAVT